MIGLFDCLDLWKHILPYPPYCREVYLLSLLDECNPDSMHSQLDFQQQAQGMFEHNFPYIMLAIYGPQ